MSEENHQMAWGVDFGAPPPQKRLGWGQIPDSARPARRGEGPAPVEEPTIPAMSWAPIEFPTAPEGAAGDCGDDDDAIDVPVFEEDPMYEQQPPTAGSAPAFQAPAPVFTPAPALPATAGGLGDLFDEDPAPADSVLANAYPELPALPAAPHQLDGPTSDPSPAEPVEPVEDPAPSAAEVGFPATAVEAGETPGDGLTTADDATPAPSFHLPVRHVPPAAVTAVATEAGGLASMFDDELAGTAVPAPTEPVRPVLAEAAPSEAAAKASTSTQVVSASGTDFASRRAALEQARAASSAQAFAPAADTSDAVTQRWLNAERYYPHVDMLLALGQAAQDPNTNAVLRSFRLTRDTTQDRQQRRQYADIMLPLMQNHGIAFDTPQDYEPIFDMAYDELIGVGPLGPLWRDDNVTEIMVSGPDKVTVERNGILSMTPVKFRDKAHLERTARDLSQRVDDRAVSRTNPLVTAQLPGARVQFAMRPVAATSGVIIVIRKFRELFGMQDLLTFGSLDERMAAFLCDAVAARATVLVSGGTGSGKTTMINALSSFIPDTERVVTIEDALELQLSNTHVESLLTKESASGDDQVIIGQAELLKATLRMRPDRIIVGEIRDGRGCSVMLQAANTGHDGTMTTIHANTPDLAVERMADLLREERPLPDEVAKNQVTSAINLVVQIVRKRGRRYISAISVVNADRGTAGQLRQLTVPLFVGEYAPGEAHPVFTQVGGLGSDTELAQKMYDAGVNPTAWEKVP